MKIIAVGSPKGGVGKTTTAVTLATVAAKAGAAVLLVDGDSNGSAWDWAGSAGDAIPVDVARVDGPDELGKLRRAGGFDLLVLDLPGARADAFRAVLAGADGAPVPDLLVVPALPEVMDLRPVLRVVRGEVMPLGLPHLMVFTKVPTLALPRAVERQAEVRAAGLTVADTIIRRYSVYDEAVERAATVLDVPGQHSYARAAEADYRALTAEVLAAVGFTTEGTHHG